MRLRAGTQLLVSSPLVACAALLAGCSDDPSSPQRQPTVSTLRVTVSTSGADIDADGYLVIVDRSPQPVRVASNGWVAFAGLALGTHSVDLAEVAPNCVVDGGSSVVTVSSRGPVTDTELHVTCSALGTVRVTVTTTGSDLDENGYTVTANATNMANAVSADIRTSEGTAVVRLAAGHYVTRLSGVAANCTGDLGPRELDVVSGATQTLDFAIVCERVRRLAYVAYVDDNNSEIYTVRSDGTGTLRLTNNGTVDTDPAWSPDGTRIAFTSERDGGRAIYVMNADGSDVKRLTSFTEGGFHPSWSPDGSRIAFVGSSDRNVDVYVMNADGTGQRRLTNHTRVDTDPAWSPDGARIAFSSDRDGNHEIYVMNADGSGVTRLTSDPMLDEHPAWSPDGTRLAFASTRCRIPSPADNCYPAVIILGPAGPPVEVAIGADPAWSPDGRKIAVTRFTCDYVYSYYYDFACSYIGIGILVPLTNGTSGSQSTWDSQVTAGPHVKPAWQP